jgi:hypothetical protein
MLLLNHGPARSIGAGVHAETERDNCANRVRGCPPIGTGWTLSDFKRTPGVRQAIKADRLGPLRSALVTSALVTRAAKPATTGRPRCAFWMTPGLSVRVRRIAVRNLTGATPDYVAQAPKGRRGVPRSNDRRSIVRAEPLHGSINVNQAACGLPFFCKGGFREPQFDPGPGGHVGKTGPVCSTRKPGHGLRSDRSRDGIGVPSTMATSVESAASTAVGQIH